MSEHETKYQRHFTGTLWYFSLKPETALCLRNISSLDITKALTLSTT